MYIIAYFLLCLGIFKRAFSVYDLGQFQVAIPFDSEDNALITVLDKTGSSIIWRTIYNAPFLTVGNATLERPPILNGNYQVEEAVEVLSNRVLITKVRFQQYPA